jgi:hypothetical protein
MREKRIVKIGDTKREVMTRVKEQDSTSTFEEIIVIMTLEIPFSLDGKEFRDHAIHHALEMDGRLRPRSNREFFVIDSETEEEQCAVIRDIVQKTCQDINSGRVELELTPDQYESMEDALDAFESGAQTQLMEFAPRFGKTIWTMALHCCIDEQVMVVATYWLSALTSFKTDITKFTNFVDMVYLEANADDFEDTFAAAIATGKKVVVGVSLYKNAGGLETKVEDLSTLVDFEDKWIYVDEADFGAHKEGQTQIIDALCPDRALRAAPLTLSVV